MAEYELTFCKQHAGAARTSLGMAPLLLTSLDQRLFAAMHTASALANYSNRFPPCLFLRML